MASFEEYHRFVTKQDPEERVRMLDCISTNETHFFREPRQFEFIEERIAPAWREAAAAGSRPRHVRAWSTACSTGEEPYSLAMTLLACFPPQSGWQVEVLASDLSTRALDSAQQAVWPLERARAIPERLLKRYMLRGTRSQEGNMRVGPEVRSVVRFERINLNRDGYPVPGHFDLIFCRNVLIYFDAATKARVVRNLIGHLEPTGYLVLGHAESVLGTARHLQRVGPTIYGRPGVPAQPAR
jgi:chemotaxis protein methyltransferase CheR